LEEIFVESQTSKVKRSYHVENFKHNLGVPAHQHSVSKTGFFLRRRALRGARHLASIPHANRQMSNDERRTTKAKRQTNSTTFFLAFCFLQRNGLASNQTSYSSIATYAFPLPHPFKLSTKNPYI